MPTVVGIRVKCPECGATTQAVGDVVKCQYCGTESRVQRRTTVFQQPIPLPPQQPHFPPRVAVQQKNNAVVATIFGITIAMVMIPIAVMAVKIGIHDSQYKRGKQQASAQAKPRDPIYREWQTNPPWFVDIDGDGKDDPIGIVRYLSNRDEMRFAAHSAKDGHLLWETPSLGTYIDTYRAQIVVDAGTILWASEVATRMLAFDVTTGKKRWEIHPQEATEQFCRANDQIYIELKDKTMWTIDRTTGALAKLAKPVTCNPTELRPHVGNELWGAHIDGVSFDSGYYPVPEGWIVTGTKSPGTPIPMIVSLDKKKKERWRAILPPVDPMTAQRYAWPVLGIDDKAVTEIAVYEKQAPRIEVFDRQTGARLLDIPLGLGKDAMVSGAHPIALHGDAIYVNAPDGLRAYDRTTGKSQWLIPRFTQ